MIVLNIIVGCVIWVTGIALFPDEDWGVPTAFCIAFAFTVYFFPETEYEYLTLTETTGFVSSNSSVATEGTFTLFGGSNGAVPIYKLRKEVGKNQYKDFIVRDAVLEETDKLISTGEYLYTATCPTRKVTNWLWLTKVESAVGEYWLCKDKKYLIKVPMGSIVKHVVL